MGIQDLRSTISKDYLFKKKNIFVCLFRLDPDEEAALSVATLEDIMALADILNTNPQDFVMEAYADPLQYFPPDPPNETNPQAGWSDFL